MNTSLFFRHASRSRLAGCLLTVFVFLSSYLSVWSQTFTQTSASETLGKVGQPFSFVLTASTNPTTSFTFSVDTASLPPGLTYNSSTATISGTPNLACQRTVRITPSNPFADRASNLVIAITPPGDSLYEENFETFTVGNGALSPAPASAGAPFFTFTSLPVFTPLDGDAIQGITTNSALNASRIGRLGGTQTSLNFASNTSASFGFFPGIAGTFTRNIRASGRTLVTLTADILITRNPGGVAQDFEFYFYDATDASGSIANYHSSVRFTASNTLQVRDAAGNTPYISTGLTFSENTPYQLTIQLDYQLNRWSATLRNLSNGQILQVADKRSMNVSGWSSLIPFNLVSIFTTNSAGTPGKDSILFDNLRVSASVPVVTPPPPVEPPVVVPPAAPTRVIKLSGKTSFGTRALRTKTKLNFKIQNTGDSVLAVKKITLPAGFSGTYKGAVAPGKTAAFQVTFTPTAKKTYRGTLRVVSDATTGTSSLTISGVGK